MKHQPTTIRLSFCIYGDYFDVDKVTNIVGFLPTETAYKGAQFYQSVCSYFKITCLCRNES